MELKKKIFIYILYSTTLYLGLIFSENSSGGAKIDANYLYPFIVKFSEDFNQGFKLFLDSKSILIHSPVFYILSGYLLKFFGNLLLLKSFYIFISCFLPLIFYFILKERNILNIKNIYLFYLSLIIFYSPYFRGSAIWLLGDNLSLIFFSLSILFYLKGVNLNSSKYIYLSFFALILCSYIRYYYCIYAIFFLFEYYKYLRFKNFLILIFLSILFSLPALAYFYFLYFNSEFFSTFGDWSRVNYINSSLQLFTIIFFYIFIIVISQLDSFLNYLKFNRNIIISFLIIFLIFYILNYYILNASDVLPWRGGGVFVRILKFLGLEQIFFLFIISFISLIFLDFVLSKNRSRNYLLIFSIITSLSLIIVYQKYLDPLFYILLFGLIDSDAVNNFIKNYSKTFVYLHIYLISFFIFSLLFYLNI